MKQKKKKNMCFIKEKDCLFGRYLLDRVHFWIREEQPGFSYSSYSPGTPCKIWDPKDQNSKTVNHFEFEGKIKKNYQRRHDDTCRLWLGHLRPFLPSDWSISAMSSFLIGPNSADGNQTNQKGETGGNSTNQKPVRR